MFGMTAANDTDWRQRACNAINFMMWRSKRGERGYIDHRSSYILTERGGKPAVKTWVSDRYCKNQLCKWYGQFVDSDNGCSHFDASRFLSGPVTIDAVDLIADAGKLALIDGKRVSF